MTSVSRMSAHGKGAPLYFLCMVALFVAFFSPANAMIRVIDPYNGTVVSRIDSFDANMVVSEYRLSALMHVGKLSAGCELTWPITRDARILVLSLQEVFNAGCDRLSDAVVQVNAIVGPPAVIVISTSVKNPGYQDEDKWGILQPANPESDYARAVLTRFQMVSAADGERLLAIPPNYIVTLTNAESVKTTFVLSEGYNAIRWSLFSVFLLLLLYVVAQMGFLVYQKYSEGAGIKFRMFMFGWNGLYALVRVIQYGTNEMTWGPHATWPYPMSRMVYWLGLLFAYFSLVALLVNWASITDRQVGAPMRIRRAAMCARILAYLGIPVLAILGAASALSESFPASATASNIEIAFFALLVPILTTMAFMYIYLGSFIIASIGRVRMNVTSRAVTLKLTIIVWSTVLGFAAFLVQLAASAAIRFMDLKPIQGAAIDLASDITAVFMVSVILISISVRAPVARRSSISSSSDSSGSLQMAGQNSKIPFYYRQQTLQRVNPNVRYVTAGPEMSTAALVVRDDQATHIIDSERSSVSLDEKLRALEEGGYDNNASATPSDQSDESTPNVTEHEEGALDEIDLSEL